MLFGCKFCTVQFHSFQEMKSHLRYVNHEEAVNSDPGECFYGECEICGREFTSRSALYQHFEATCHEVDILCRPIPSCNDCHIEFESWSKFYQHRERMHRAIRAVEEYECNECTRLFRSPSALAQHKQSTGHGQIAPQRQPPSTQQQECEMHIATRFVHLHLNSYPSPSSSSVYDTDPFSFFHTDDDDDEEEDCEPRTSIFSDSSRNLTSHSTRSSFTSESDEGRPYSKLSHFSSLQSLNIATMHSYLDEQERLLTCPLTLDLLEDPVLLSCCGKTVSRAPLTRWINFHGRVCPFDRSREFRIIVVRDLRDLLTLHKKMQTSANKFKTLYQKSHDDDLLI